MDVCRHLKSEFESHFSKPHAEVVSRGGKRIVEHVVVQGLPQLGLNPHASVGNGHIYVAAVLGCTLRNGDESGAFCMVEGGIKAEAYRCCQIIEQVLRACSAAWGDLVWLSVRIPSLTDDKIDVAEATIDHFCREHASGVVPKSIVGCDALRHSASIQLEAVAVTAFGDSASQNGASSVLTNPSPIIPLRSSPAADPRRPSMPSPPGLIAPIGSPTLHEFYLSEGEHVDVSEAVTKSLEGVPFSSLASVMSGTTKDACTPLRKSSKLEQADKTIKDSSGEYASSVETASPNQAPVSSEVSSTTTSPPQQSGGADDIDAVVSNSCMQQDVERRDGSLQPCELLTTALTSLSSDLGDAVPEISSKDKKRQRGKRGSKAGKSTDPQVVVALDGDNILQAQTRIETNGMSAVIPAVDVFQPQQRSATTAADDKPILRPFAGNALSLVVEDITSQKDCNIMADFQLNETTTFRVQMVAEEVYRTVRIGPAEILCSRLDESSWAQKARGSSSVTWRYEFDVALMQTRNCYVNIGLVEWIAPITEPAFQALHTRDADVHLSLAKLMGLLPGEEWKTEPAWQHEAENPRQRMLGCKKGVRWFGERQNWSEQLFKDDILPGSILRFQCDHTFDESGHVKEMKLWLAASKIYFRWKEPKGQPQTVEQRKPIFVWPSPGEQRTNGSKDKKLQSVWVPAVTFYNKDDSVLFSWTGPHQATSIK